jgi:membrane protein
MGLKAQLTKIHQFAIHFVIPGFDGIPFSKVLGFYFKGLLKGSINLRASAVAFNFFIALFPSLIFFFTIIPYLPIPHFDETLFALLEDLLPTSTHELVLGTANDIITRPRGGLLSFGFFFALFFSTTGINSLIDAFNQTYHSIEQRSFLKQQLISIFLVLILSCLIIIGIVLLIGGDVLINYLVELDWIKSGFKLLTFKMVKWLIVIIIFFFAISFLYYLGPSKKQKFRFISAGATLSTLLIIGLAIGFNYYIENFSRYNTLYGSIGTLIIVMLWIYFIAMVILIGFDLNASISKLKRFN